MTGKDARRIARSLVRSDALRRLGFRFAAWAAFALAAWSLVLLASVLLLESGRGPSPLAFHVVVMSALGLLPAFLAYPFSAGYGLEAVRRCDLETRIETWLDYRGGPAARLLEARAREALSIAAIAGFRKPKPPRTQRAVVIGILSVAAAAFLAAQAASLSSGYGLSFSYPEKPTPDFTVERDRNAGDPYRSIVAPAVDEPDADRGQPGSRRYAGAGPEDDTAGEPDFGPSGGGEAGPASRDGTDGYERTERRIASAGGEASGEGGAESGNGGRSDEGGDSAGRDSSGEARSPGWEGRGGAIDASPFVDYRARFERQFAESSGRETTLGDEPSAELVSAAITEFYA
ncbi:MAG: hypothetical protein KKA67_15840, partial [Spirochaetes bacterium]|nr:hypothetical protein [Spirochaetota bacterium]